jgi:hypothetical protein
MYKITVKGEARTKYKKPWKLDGIDCQDNFSEYFSGQYGSDPNQQSLIDKKVSGGYMFFKWENELLMTYTKYDCSEMLTDEELKILGNYTQGQWSDGIGEGFEQHPCYDTPKGKEVFISPWQQGQVLHLSQQEYKIAE